MDKCSPPRKPLRDAARRPIDPPGVRLASARCDCVAMVVAVGLLVSGCSSEQVYNAAAGWRRNECNKFAEQEQRDRCLKEADRSYDAYRKALPPPQ